LVKSPTPSDPFSVNIKVNNIADSESSYPIIAHPDLDEVIFLKTVDSTNLELKRRHKEFRGANILLISNEQTQGQGQKGRAWESAPGRGLWMSLHLGNPKTLSHSLQLLSIYTGTIVHKVISPLIDTKIRLKWPNDIMVGSKKCGGILTELQWQGEAVSSAIIGVGINLNHQKHDFSTPIQKIATSLHLEGHENPDRVKLAQSFVNEFFMGLAHLDKGTLLVANWNNNAFKLNQSIIWDLEDKSFEGEFYGINKRGDALILIDGEFKVFQTGEIRLSTSA